MLNAALAYLFRTQIFIEGLLEKGLKMHHLFGAHILEAGELGQMFIVLFIIAKT